MSTSFAVRFVAKVEAPLAAKALGLEMISGDGGWKWVGQCPACAEDGNDRSGKHLVVFEDGRFACITKQGEVGSQHRSRMAKLCPALRGTGNTTGEIYIKPDLIAEREALKAAYAVMFESIKAAYSGGLESLGESATVLPDPRWHFDTFCNLFQPDDIVWVGHLKDAGPMGMKKDKVTGEIETWETPPHRLFSRHTFKAGDPAERDRIWTTAARDGLDLTRGNSWKPGSVSRDKHSVAALRFVPVEHDDAPREDQVGLIRYTRDVLGWDLRMVVDTTGKSIHGLFDVSQIERDQLTANVETLIGLGVDSQSIRQAATRAPGLVRQPNPDKPEKPHGQRQTILWIKP